MPLEKGSPLKWRRVASQLAARFDQFAVRLVIAHPMGGESLTDWQFRFNGASALDSDLLRRAGGTWDGAALVTNTGNGRVTRFLPQLVERYGAPTVQRVKVERWGADLRPISFEVEGASSLRPSPAECVLLARAAGINLT